MVNRILYRFITLPILAKFGCLSTLVIIFACSFTTIASIPATRQRQAAQVTQTVLALQSQATQVALNNTATSVADTAATTQANQYAAATRIADAQNATQTSVIVAQIATQTAIAVPTVTAQAAIDATNTIISGATATSQAFIDATNTAIAQQTAVVVQATAAELAYIDGFTKQTRNISSALTKISELTQVYENSDDWNIQMATQILRVRSAHEALTKLDPPRRFRKLHALILAATSDCNASMDKLVSGIDEGSASDIRRATALMQSCNDKTKPALTELNRLMQP